MLKKVLFLGTPTIACCVLKAIYDLNTVKIIGVFSQPDKQRDRHNKIVYSPVKQFCLDKNIKCFQPANINHEIELIKTLQPDLIITCAYGQFISDEILKIPKYKCVNFHASLLPKLRGGAPIHWAIINGEKETGISLMYMVKKMDAGNVIKQYKIKIENNDTYKSLYEKMCNLVQDIVRSDFMKLFNDKLQSTPQDENEVTFGLNIKKEDTFIDFNQPAHIIFNLIRGLNDKPVAKFMFNQQQIKVYESEITPIASCQKPGQIISISKNGIEVCTKDFNLLLTVIQLPSKNINHIKNLVNGTLPFKVNDLLT